MQIVRRDSGPDTGASLLPQHLLAILPDSTLESGGEGNRIASGQMPTGAAPRAVFHGAVHSSGDGHPGNY